MTQSSTSTGATIPQKKKDTEKSTVVAAAAVIPPTSSCGAQIEGSGSPDTSRKKRKISHSTAQAVSTSIKVESSGDNPSEGASGAMTSTASTEQMSASNDPASSASGTSRGPISAGNPQTAAGGNDNSATASSGSGSNQPISGRAGETIPATPSGTAQQRKAGSGKGALEDPRRKQILSLISHRRLLLRRMGQCRQAAEDRLDRMAQERRRQRREEAQRRRQETAASYSVTGSESVDAKKDASNINKSEKNCDASKMPAPGKKSSEQKNGAVPADNEPISDEDDEDEVEAFRKMTKLALSTSKRQKWDASAGGGGAAGEKGGGRGSISLRRGSSVGKKMAAAVNMLTNQGGWASDSSGGAASSGSTGPHFPLHTGSATSMAHPGRGPMSSSIAPAGTVPSSAIPTGAPPSSAALAAAGIANPAALAPPGLSRKSSITPHKQQHPNAAGAASASLSSAKMAKSSSSSQLGGGKKQSQKNKRSGSQKSMRASSVGNGNLQASADPSLSANQPLHYDAGGSINVVQTGGTSGTGGGRYYSGTVSNGGAGAQQQPKIRSNAPPVLCPEAAALREKRNAIRQKLTKLLYERQLRALEDEKVGLYGRSVAERGVGSVASAQAKSSSVQVQSSSVDISARTTGPQHKQFQPVAPRPGVPTPAGLSGKHQKQPSTDTQQIAWAAALAQTQGTARHLTPVRLPPRRKTHWDYVLEEMRWLSTDFIEERKWKIAAGRTLSCAIRSHCATPAATSPTKRKASPVKDNESVKVLPVTSTEGGEKQPSVQPEEDGKLAAVSTLDVEEDEPVALYPDPTPEDVECVKSTSKILSMVVMEHWDSVAERGAFAPSDSFYAAGYRRFLKMKQRHEKSDRKRRHLASLSEKNALAKGDVADGSSCVSPDVVADAAEISSIEKDPKSAELSATGVGGQRDGSTLPKLSCSDTTSAFSPQEQSYDQITAMMQCATDNTNEFKSSLVSGSSEHGPQNEGENSESGESSGDIHKELKGCALELNPVQIDAMQFVENLWNSSISSCESPEDKGKNMAIASAKNGSAVASVGAILHGGVGCGKTITVGALLWKHRCEGPQLIICPPTSVIRWRHELGRFRNLNVFTYGHHGWSYGHPPASSAPTQIVSPYRPCDVVLCEFSSISVFFGDKTEDKRKEGVVGCTESLDIAQFVTLTLDARHPVTLGPPSFSSTSAQSANKKKKSVPKAQYDDLLMAMVPPELLSTKWWNNLLQIISISPKVKRLLLENVDFASQKYPLSSGGESFGDDKRMNEILAMKVALVHHPSIFHSPRSTISKRVISWAKRHNKKNYKRISSKSDKVAVSHVGSINGVLKGALFPFGILHDKNDISNNDNSSLSENENWEIRICPMSATQRTAYDQCCSHLRGALSSIRNPTMAGCDSSCLQDSIASVSSLDCSARHVQSNGNMMVANAILRLRKVCLHSHMHNMLLFSQKSSIGTELLKNNSSDSSRNQNYTSDRNSNILKNNSMSAAAIPKGCATNSPSEPNFELARCIVENSCKMRELLLVLSTICGHSVMYKEKLFSDGRRGACNDANSEPIKATESKKVLIVATLPEAQLLVSMLLSAVGLPHEMFLTTNPPPSTAQQRAGAMFPSNDNTASAKSENSSSTDSALPIGTLDYDEEGLYYCDTTKKIIHNIDSAVAWMRCQHFLTRYDADECFREGTSNIKDIASNTSDSVSPSIIVASAVAVGFNHGGLYASAADVVISVDEDWSGRGNSLMNSISSRIRTRHFARKAARPTCKFIKLISENTCEQLFFTDFVISDQDKDVDNNEASIPANKAKAKNGFIRTGEGGKEEDQNRSFDSKVRRGERRKNKTSSVELVVENCASVPACADEGKRNDMSSRFQRFATDRRGYIVTSSLLASSPLSHGSDCSKSTTPNEYTRKSFVLGESIWKFCNTRLSVVLCTPQSLQCTFMMDSDLLFLPKQGSKEIRCRGENDGMLRNTKGMSNEIEDSLDFKHNDDGGRALISTVERGVFFGLSLAQAEEVACPLSDKLIPSLLTSDGESYPSFHEQSYAAMEPFSSSAGRLLSIFPPFLSDFPPSVMSRRDVASMSLRRYVERIGRSSLQCRLRANSTNALTWQPSVSADAVEASEVEGVVSGKIDFDLADAWHKSGLSCKPDDLAASLLVYNLPIPVDTDKLTTQKKTELIESEQLVGGVVEKCEMVANHDEDLSVEPSQQSLKRKRRSRSTGQGHNENRVDREQSFSKKRYFRTNFYSMSYAASRNARSTVIRDGNQGYEPLVYFPPLFPGMLLSARSASSTMEDMMIIPMQNKFENITPGFSGSNQASLYLSSKKRKDHIDSALVASSGKRARHSSPTYNKATASTIPNSIHSNALGVSPMLPASAQLAPSSSLAGTPKPGSTSSAISTSSLPTIPLSSPSANLSFAPSAVTSTPSSNVSTDQQGLYSSKPKSRPASTIVTEDESSDTDASTVLLDVNDDFGLLGVGALPFQHESLKLAYATSIETNAYSFWRDHFEPNSFDDEEWFPICDAEEANATIHGHGGQPYLDLMILFVKKRSQTILESSSFGMGSNTYSSLPSSQQPNSLSTSALLATLGKGSIAAVVNDKGIQYVSGNRRSSSSSKKAKKGQHSLAATTNDASFSSGSMHFIGGTTSHASILQPKQAGIVMRGSSGRFSGHSASGRVICERAPVRAAAVRLRYRLTNRVSDISVTSGSSASSLSTKQDRSSTVSPPPYSTMETSHRIWTNAVMKLASPNGKTGDRARMVSTTQRASLRRSLVSPCRVDFGPFHVGYLSPPGGMTGISPPRTRVGISLPMGVKVPQHNQQPSTSTYPEPWTDSEDKKLKACVARFCFNWHMASRAVTGVIDGDLPMSVQHQNTGVRSVSQVFRSARQCRERWQLLAKTQPSLAKEVRRVERMSREMAVRTPREVPKSLGGIIREMIDIKQGRSKEDAGQEVSNLKGLSLSRSFETHLEQTKKRNSSKDTLLVSPALLSTSDKGYDRNSSMLHSMVLESSGSAVRSGTNTGNKMAALKAAGKKRQHVPISIPGCAGNDPATLPVVQSHPSHAESVRSASSAVRGELWPLQLLDLAEKQRQAAEGVAQRQDVSSNMSSSSSRQHRSGVSAASHPQQAPVAPPQNVARQQRTQPTSYQQMTQQQHQAATLTAPTAAIAAPMQTTSQQQQELVKQAARAAALGSPPPKSRPAPTTSVGIGSAPPPQHAQQQQHAVPMMQQQPVQPQQVTYMNQAQHQTPQQVAGVGSPPVMQGHQQAQPVDMSRIRHQTAGASTLPPKPPPT